MTAESIRQIRFAPTLEVSKSQDVRLLDVLVIGPALMYLATRERLSHAQRVVLFAVGAATVIYNARNYASTQQHNIVQAGVVMR